MPQTFNCSHCGGTLEITSSEATVVCPYCHNSEIVPETLRQAALSQEAAASLKKMSPYVKIFLIVIAASIILPACVGVIGTLIAIVAGLFGIATPFLLFFAR